MEPADPLNLAGVTGGAAPALAPGVTEARLRAIDDRFVAAFAAHDAHVLDEMVADDFTCTGSDGGWLTREEFLARMRKSSPFAGLATIEDLHVRVFGPAAVALTLFVVVARDGGQVRIRGTDVYAWDGHDWRLVNVQHTSLAHGVDAQQRTATAIAADVAWQGCDPVGHEVSVLRTLNEQYVEAFRDADVAWYGAHLAPDYVVVYGDGSLHDRHAALADFAQPYFATHLESFPVGVPHIRRFGDLAVVRAENDYRRKDGRSGINRYTDLWLERDGRWQCIAAHITVHKPPS